ncbi:YhcG family protein [Haloferula sp. A504]|uniref:YhcG family protein n=1 Tax=Haloferula sp. A504 TaxID=3373601 RepID=UPI0031C4D40A|nr:PDDEXK nuclease domain-containing protein [Verrucomicrobiaceae bacterium E54]
MNFDQLVTLCGDTHRRFAAAAGRTINAHLTARNFLLGLYIVHFEQEGEDRAGYGKQTLKALSSALQAAVGRGFSVDNLELMRRFYLQFGPEILRHGISETPSRISQAATPDKSETLSRISTEIARAALPGGEMMAELPALFPLGWSHYVELLTIDSPDERRFYEIEAAANQWGVRELRRQIASSLYERLALSRDKEEIRRLASEGQVVEKAADLIKNPLVLEFLGLDERPHYSEDDLESAIIDRLESFLLELGKGFLFEGRQKRFTFDNDHFFVDLVFYNRLLRCYVLIDLKRDKLTHQDLGQMQMYVNYFDRHVKLDDELPTIGIVLCHRKNDALVELTLPADANIFASKYQLYLPSKEELKARLEQITEDLEGGLPQ